MNRLDKGDLITVKQALALVPIGRTLLYELIRDGEIPAIRVAAAGSRRGRLLIHRVDLEAFVERSRSAVTHSPSDIDVDQLLKRIRSRGTTERKS